MDILIGTKNKYKSTEMVSFLGNFPEVKITYLEDLGIQVKVEEDQPTLEENAQKKAVELSKLTDMYVLASDGGVDIPGLGDKWDILRNQRIVGEESTDLEKTEKLLSMMKGLKGEERRASYRLALALALKGQLIWSTEQISDVGYIVEELPDQEIPQYKWMGHLWYYPQFTKVFNKLSEEEKEVVREQGSGIKKSLRRKIKEIIEKS
jgi:XTP/dITP diphosphohydrolase